MTLKEFIESCHSALHRRVEFAEVRLHFFA
jgi:hypothetical protein